MKKFLTAFAGIVVGLGAVGVMASPAYADGGSRYTLQFTGGLGAYPRSAPTYEARTGAAIPEGATIHGSCWLNGSDVTNPFNYTSSVWVRDAGGLYWPEAWLDTGSNGIPVGLASCDALDESTATTAWQPNCTPGGAYIVGSISVTDTGEGRRISIMPTATARDAWGVGQGWDSTVAMWHAIQDCVPGLYDSTADSVWQQLECHQRFATITKPDGSYATGDTYDLETWTDPLDAPNDLNYVLSRCLNQSPEQYDSWFAPLRLFAITG